MTGGEVEGKHESENACTVCGAVFDSLSVHEGGLMVNLFDNDRYRRVCFDPGARDGVPVVEFYHHTHEQVDADDSGEGESERVGVDPEDRRGDPVESTDSD